MDKFTESRDSQAAVIDEVSFHSPDGASEFPVLNAFPFPVLILDEDHGFVFANQAAGRMFDFDPGEWRNTGFYREFQKAFGSHEGREIDPGQSTVFDLTFENRQGCQSERSKKA